MPKYYEFKIAGYYLYFTSYCVIECMHVHASDRRLTEAGSAKFFVRDNGDTVLQERGILTDREISKIQKFIKQNYQEMYLKWSAYSEQGFYNKKGPLPFSCSDVILTLTLYGKEGTPAMGWNGCVFFKKGNS